MEPFDYAVPMIARLWSVMDHKERTQVVEGHQRVYHQDPPISDNPEWVAAGIATIWWNVKSWNADGSIHIEDVAAEFAVFLEDETFMASESDAEFEAAFTMKQDELLRRLVDPNSVLVYMGAEHVGAPNVRANIVDEQFAEVYGHDREWKSDEASAHAWNNIQQALEERVRIHQDKGSPIGAEST